MTGIDRTPALVADMLDATHELVDLSDGIPLSSFVADRLRCLAAEKLFIEHEVLYRTIREDLPPVAAALEAWLSSRGSPDT